MAKLRLIRERKVNEKSFEYDLRGFESEPFITESSPLAMLLIKGEHPGRWTHETFRCTCDNGMTFIRMVQMDEGTHKSQALSLFLGFLENHHQLPSDTRALLLQVDRMGLHMRNAIQKQQTAIQDPVTEEYSKRVTKQEDHLVVDSVIVMHLKQAGFPIEESGTDHHFSRNDLQDFIKKVLSAPEYQSIYQRKAG